MTEPQLKPLTDTISVQFKDGLYYYFKLIYFVHSDPIYELIMTSTKELEL